jgi:hypothetical protein
MGSVRGVEVAGWTVVLQYGRDAAERASAIWLIPLNGKEGLPCPLPADAGRLGRRRSDGAPPVFNEVEWFLAETPSARHRRKRQEQDEQARRHKADLFQPLARRDQAMGDQRQRHAHLQH